MKHTASIIIGLLFYSTAFSQNVGVGTSTPDESAALDVESADKGLLIPRTDTATVNASGVTIAEGLMIYDESDEAFYYFDGVHWAEFITTNNEEGDDLGTHEATENIVLNGQFLSNDGDNEGVSISNSGDVDVSGEIVFTGDDYYPAATEKTTVIVFGVVNTDGSVDPPYVSSLYTVEPDGNGVYNIKFPSGTFAAPPALTATCRDLPGEIRIAAITNITPEDVQVVTKKIDGGLENTAFSFIAVGVR